MLISLIVIPALKKIVYYVSSLIRVFVTIYVTISNWSKRRNTLILRNFGLVHWSWTRETSYQRNRQWNLPSKLREYVYGDNNIDDSYVIPMSTSIVADPLSLELQSVSKSIQIKVKMSICGCSSTGHVSGTHGCIDRLHARGLNKA